MKEHLEFMLLTVGKNIIKHGIQTFDGKDQTGYCWPIRGPQLNRQQ
jgi:hypothetical protein